VQNQGRKSYVSSQNIEVNDRLATGTTPDRPLIASRRKHRFAFMAEIRPVHFFFAIEQTTMRTKRKNCKKCIKKKRKMG